MKILHTTVLTVATAIFMAPSVAGAATYHHSDASHDVVSVPDDSVGSPTTAEAGRSDGDVLTTSVVHGPRRVRMALHAAALEKSGDLAVHRFSVATSKHRIRTFSVVASPGHWQGSLQRTTGRGTTFRCKGVHWSIDYAAATVALSVPRRCLGRPAWVRVALSEAKGDGATDYFDDANTTGFTADGTPRYGARVYR